MPFEDESQKFYKALRKALIDGHGPVEAVTYGDGGILGDTDTKTEFRDGTLRIRHKAFSPGFMLVHEIAHVLFASDADIFKPNIGLPPFVRNQVQGATPQDGLNEAWIIVAGLRIQARYGSLNDAALKRFREMGALFAIPAKDESAKDAKAKWHAEFDRHWADPKINVRALRREWFRKMRLIAAHNRANEKAEVRMAA